MALPNNDGKIQGCPSTLPESVRGGYTYPGRSSDRECKATVDEAQARRNVEATSDSYVVEKGGQGVKYDQDKTRYDLVPPEALDEIAKVLTFGAHKYSDRNWEAGMRYGRTFAATMRHLWAWWRGEDKDPETGLSHLAHAGCCIFFALTLQARGRTDLDDRPKPTESKVLTNDNYWTLTGTKEKHEILGD